MRVLPQDLRARNNQQGRVNAYSYCVVSLRSSISVGLKENIQNHVSKHTVWSAIVETKYH